MSREEIASLCSHLEQASTTGDISLLQNFIDAQFDFNQPINAYGDTLAIIAAQNNRPDLIRLLHGLRADLNLASQYGMTPAFMAAVLGHIDVMKALHACGADLNQMASDHATPLLLATAAGRLEVVQFLVSKNYPIVAWRINARELRSHVREKNEAVIKRAEAFIATQRLMSEDALLDIYPSSMADIMGHEEIARILDVTTLFKNELHAMKRRCVEKDYEWSPAVK